MKVYYWYIFLFIATARGGCRSNSPPNPGNIMILFIYIYILLNETNIINIVMPGSPTDGDPKILPLLFPIINTKMEAQGFTSFNITHYLKCITQILYSYFSYFSSGSRPNTYFDICAEGHKERCIRERCLLHKNIQ